MVETKIYPSGESYEVRRDRKGRKCITPFFRINVQSQNGARAAADTLRSDRNADEWTILQPDKRQVIMEQAVEDSSIGAIIFKRMRFTFNRGGGLKNVEWFTESNSNNLADS